LRQIDHPEEKTMDGDRVPFNDRALSRRTAMFASGSGIGVGIALAAGPVQAQHQVMTNSEGLVAGPVWISTADGKPMPGYRAMPANGNGLGTILVVQEVFGVHAYIADVCRRFAKAGYYAIAPELYFRQGDPRYYTDIPSLLKEVVSKVPDEQVMKDLDSSVAFAKGEGKADTAKLGITGFCWGGRIVWLYDAYNPAVKAGVAWYGRVVGDGAPMTPKHPLDVVDQLHGPVQGLYGGADTGIPNDTVEKMREALKKSSNPAALKSTIKTYPDTPHGFNADYRPSYRKEQAEDGWKLALAWFKANGVG
jgi:carboxymethylenebutenolidase